MKSVPAILINRYKNLRLQTKLIVSYLLVVLLPVIIIGYYFISQTTKENLLHTQYTNQVSSQQIKTNMEFFFVEYLKLSDSILFESQIMNYLEKNYDSDSDYSEKFLENFKILEVIKYKFALISNNVKITVYTNNPSILTDNEFIKNSDKTIENQPWYKQAINAKGENIIASTDSNGEEAYFVIGRLLKSSSDSKYTNVLRIQINEKELFRLIEKEGSAKKIYVLNNDNTIITSTDRQMIGIPFSNTPLFSKIKPKDFSTKSWVNVDSHYNTLFYDVLASRKPSNKCKIITYISAESVIEKINSIIRISVIIILINVFIAIILVVVFSTRLTYRLKRLVSNMSKIRDGNFDVNVTYDEKDEIGELSHSFRNMIERINKLISEVYIAELNVKELNIKKREAELHALQSQINPHFLFNSMESIRANLLKKGDIQTSDIIQSYSRLLRKSIDWKEENIPLKQELELVSDYLKLQKFRYREKLDYSIEVNEEFFSVMIPKFSLQPIVENSVYHGIELKDGNGFIRIYYEVICSDIKIIIEDNGMGIPEDKLNKIKDELENWDADSSTGKSIGIKNIQQRLKLCFGSKYGISIESTTFTGTKIELLVPIRNNNQEEYNV